MKERKLKDFKAGCKRSNFHNPPKSTADFWIEQSDWQLCKKRGRRSIVSVEDALMAASGPVSKFLDVCGVIQLRDRLDLDSSALLVLYQSVKIHGVFFGRNTYALLGSASQPLLCSVEQIMQVEGSVYLWLCKYPDALQSDEWGSFYSAVPAPSAKYKLISAEQTALTAIWHVKDPSDKRFQEGCLRFIVKT